MKTDPQQAINTQEAPAMITEVEVLYKDFEQTVRENMPNAGCNTISNRVSLNRGIKMTNLSNILLKWIPKNERKKRKFIYVSK